MIQNQLEVSRELYVHGLLVYEFFAVAAAWSVLAVESALRESLVAPPRTRYFKLIKLAERDGLITAQKADLFNVGREIRNMFSYLSMQPILSPSMAESMIETGHNIIFDLADSGSGKGLQRSPVESMRSPKRKESKHRI